MSKHLTTRTVDEQHLELALFMYRRAKHLAPSEKALKYLGALGQISVDRMAENYCAYIENTTVCSETNQKGYDLDNRTEVKTGATQSSPFVQRGKNYRNNYFALNGLKNKESSHHILAIIYNDVLSKTQVIKIPNSFYRNRTKYNCGINKKTGDINGLQKYIIDEG